MDNILNIAQGFVAGVTKIFVLLIPLGVVAGIVFGGNAFTGDVIGNLIALVQGLGDAGLVGLIVALILVSVFND